MECTKKMINKVETCVDENLQGVVALHPGLSILHGHRVILRSDYEQYKSTGRVCTLSGGGSGHEPTFYGLVGDGFMTGVIHGPIFASPGSKTILAAIRAVGSNHPAGVLIIYNNYTGDRLHFGQAIERARSEGIKVDSLAVGEDCAMMSKDKTTGRRGLAGSAVVSKILCAMAEDGKSLEELMEYSKIILNDIGTLGVCLSSCSLPGGLPLFQLGDDEMEIGLGLHGEAGVKRTKIMTAHDTVTTMVDYMMSVTNTTGIQLPPNSSVAILLNNLGSTSTLEMNILAMETISYIESKGHKVDRAYSGAGVTSQEMAGFSLTIFILDELRKTCLDKRTTATAWPKMLYPSGMRDRVTSSPIYTSGPKEQDQIPLTGPQVSQDVSRKLFQVLHHIGEALLAAEGKLNQLDSTSGDGDCGTTLKAGAQALLDTIGSIDSPGLPFTHPYNLLMSLVDVVESSMGGSSAALYSLFLTSAATALLKDDIILKEMLQSGLEALSRYGGAQPGDRTMIDPLHAAYKSLCDDADMERAVKAAEKMAMDTAGMAARAGRASYVASTLVTQPDPGAVAVSLWMRAGLNAWNNNI